jgi:hypothetical protein
VGVDGPLGDDQAGGDLLVGQAVCDQPGDLVFPCGQRQAAGGGSVLPLPATDTYLEYALSPIPGRKPGGYGHAEWLAQL